MCHVNRIQIFTTRACAVECTAGCCIQELFSRCFVHVTVGSSWAVESVFWTYHSGKFMSCWISVLNIPLWEVHELLVFWTCHFRKFTSYWISVLKKPLWEVHELLNRCFEHATQGSSSAIKSMFWACHSGKLMSYWISVLNMPLW